MNRHIRRLTRLVMFGLIAVTAVTLAAWPRPALASDHDR